MTLGKLLEEFFSETARNEHLVEDARLALCFDPRFNCSTAFAQLAPSQSLGLNEISRFLRDHHVVCPPDLIQFLLHQYSQTGGQDLNLEAWQRFVLPSTDDKLKEVTLSRQPSALLPDTEFLLLVLFLNELDCQRTLETIKCKFPSQLVECFLTIDPTGNDFVDVNTLSVFMQKSALYFNERDAEAVLRRLGYPYSRILTREGFLRYFNTDSAETLSPAKSTRPNTPSSRVEQPSLRHKLTSLGHLFAEQEALKTALAAEPLFDLTEAFHFFDRHGKGYITSADLDMGFDRLGISFSQTDIYLVFRRYSQDTRLSYAAFKEMLLPATSLNSRRTYGSAWETVRETFRETVQNLLRIEGIADSLRLTAAEALTLYSAFGEIDKNRSGYLEREDFAIWLGDQISDDGLSSLLRTLDRDRDGLVSYSEFFEGLSGNNVHVASN